MRNVFGAGFATGVALWALLVTVLCAIPARAADPQVQPAPRGSEVVQVECARFADPDTGSQVWICAPVEEGMPRPAPEGVLFRARLSWGDGV